MTSILRVSSRPFLILALALTGCGEAADPNVTTAPESHSAPAPATAPTETAPVAQTTDSSKEPETTPAAAIVSPTEEAATSPAEATAKVEVTTTEGAAKLEPIKFDEFLKRVANKDAKFTLVDVWASWCLPCKENFPHLVEMNAKFADKGLSVASLSFDDPTEPKQVKDAIEFLTAKKAVFANYLLDEEQGVGNEN